MKQDIKTKISEAISCDVLSSDGVGFLSIMSKGNPHIQSDIPHAFEMYSLLDHYIEKLPFSERSFDIGQPDIRLRPGVFFDPATGRLVALIDIAAGQLPEVAFWLTDSMRCAQITKRKGGLLALAFSTELHTEVEHIIPEWFASFYVDGSQAHCMPILALKSVMTDGRFGSDWMDVALGRMAMFCLPRSDAIRAVTPAPEPAR